MQRHRQKRFIIERSMAPTDFILIGCRDQTINFFSTFFLLPSEISTTLLNPLKMMKVNRKMAKIAHFYKNRSKNTSKSISNIAKKFSSTKRDLLMLFSFWFVTFVKIFIFTLDIFHVEIRQSSFLWNVKSRRNFWSVAKFWSSQKDILK